MSEFFAMGGYGAFVWPSYLASVVVLGAAVALSMLGHARARARLKQLEAEGKGSAVP